MAEQACVPQSQAQRAARTPSEVARLLGMDAEAVQRLLTYWPFWRRADQVPPEGEWRAWMVMAGRGFGKTRIGAEWVRGVAESNAWARIALVGATENDVRRVMIEGESGLLQIAHWRMRPRWEPSIGRVTWPNGARAEVFSACEPDKLRGPQHSHAWADEIGKWPDNDAWDQLLMTLRKGKPQVVATTTPRPVRLVRRLANDPEVRKTHGSTLANHAHLARDYVEAMRSYAGTRIGRQELDGELIEELAGALWQRGPLEAGRVREAPELVRVVIGVDPPAGSTGDACGIVAVGLGRDRRGYLIEDASVSGASPEGWARAVAACAARHGTDCVVAEKNQGGEMVASVLRAADAGLPLRLVHASQGKSARAEPVALLYEAGKVAHVGVFPELEDELCGLMAGGGYDGPGRSPDRADALVWAMHELMLGRRATASVRGL